MPVSIVIGGQFGAEGKGKVTQLLAKELGASVVVRVGGTNSGHTTADPKNRQIFRQLPTAACMPGVTCVLGPGSYIDPNVLLREIDQVGLSPDRLVIDGAATVISDDELFLEGQSDLRDRIGSTLSGTGEAVIRRIRRTDDLCLAKNDLRLAPYIGSTSEFLNREIEKNSRIIIEGTQGFGLSLFHSPYYPLSTSRDTTASAFAAEAGVSPLDVDDVIMVVRTFPIRVGGNSGPLPNEIDWETVTRESGAQSPLLELTSVTRTQRRVGRFDPEIVRAALRVNRPTRLVLNHLDYIDTDCFESQSVTTRAARFVEEHVLHGVRSSPRPRSLVLTRTR